MQLIEYIKALDLPKNSFVVVGSGTMVVLGLAQGDNDVDLTVTSEIFDKFKRQGWRQELFGGQSVLKDGIYDIGTQFYKWKLPDLLEDALWVEDVPFISLVKLLEWKRYMMRDSDIPQLKIIEEYLASHQQQC
jgi:hypothetical protein